MISWVLPQFKTWPNGRREHRESHDNLEIMGLQAAYDSSDELNEDYNVKKESTLSQVNYKRQGKSNTIFIISSIFAVALLMGLAFQAGEYSSRNIPITLSPVPEIPFELRMISKDPLFSQPSSLEVDEAWASLLPTDRGLITVEDSEKYELPPGLSSSSGENIYGLTWTHQYHCLNMLRVEFWSLIRNESDLPERLKSNTKEDHDHIYHKVHCFDYLRQTLMCSMDMTIEYAARDQKTGMSKGYINGWDIMRTCRNQEVVFDFMKQHAIRE